MADVPGPGMGKGHRDSMSSTSATHHISMCSQVWKLCKPTFLGFGGGMIRPPSPVTSPEVEAARKVLVIGFGTPLFPPALNT